MNITLQKFSLRDISQKYIRWLRDKELTKYTEINSPTKNQIVEYVSLNINDKNVNFFKIILNKKIHIGNLRIKHLKKRQATIALIMGDKRFKNKGLGNISLRLALNFLKKNKTKIVFAYINSKNLPSQKIFKKNGFIRSKKETELYSVYLK